MGFLKKIFQRKKTNTESKLPSKKGKKKEQKKAKTNGLTPDSRAASRSPPSHTASNSSREREVERDNDRILAPKSNGSVLISPSEKARFRNRIPGAQDENLDHFNAASSVSPRLSYQHLQQFDRQNTYGSGYGAHSTVHQPTFQMSADLPRQQMHAMDEMNRSDASSSSFNLSTDAEDSEYENLRNRGVLPGTTTNPSALDMSMSAASIPTSYTTDDDKVFPALDDLTMPSMTTGTSAKDQRYSGMDPAYIQQEEMARKLGLMPPPPPPLPKSQIVRPPTPDDEPGHIQISPKKAIRDDPGAFGVSPSTEASNELPSTRSTKSNSRSWGVSPSMAASIEPVSTKSSSKSNQFFNFEEPSLGLSNRPANDYSYTSTHPPSTNSRNTPGSLKRSFTSPESQASSSAGFGSDDFVDFADFSNFKKWGEEQIETKSNARGDFDRAFHTYQSPPKRDFVSSPTSNIQQDRSLSELLALAKNKNRNSTPNRHQRRTSSSSVNSAPAITSSYLRQYNNLGKYSKSGYGDRNDREGIRVPNDETSVSDIIQSLEVSNQMRKGGRNTSSNLSVGDTGASTIARLAKERLREKQRREAEYNASMGMRSSDSSDNSDYEASESWLFDGVTSALGPRGIAADLESLSGRSNRSKNSQGNKSHRSRHSKSHRSSRRPRSSTESVDSRGSRQSRNSRNSRYSHRSTKSYLSQMSQESQSVANDLLRLEMQLAMVGSQENRDDVPARAMTGNSGSSFSSSSRHGRSSRKPFTSPRSSASSLSKRVKVSVIAPPGKLGVILANKADSKGTVVSGVRTSSALADKVFPGDRIIAIDGEDVSRMTVSEITSIMARKAEYERKLTILTLHNDAASIRSPSKGDEESPRYSHHFESSYQQYRR